MSEPRAEQELTFSDAARMDPDEAGGELVDGTWVPVTRNTWRHGKVVFNVALQLGQYARDNPGWSIAVGDPGTKLSHDPDTLRGPDIGVIRAEREPTGHGAAGWLDGAPELAIEVAGDRQSVTELTEKALEYLAAGGRMVWVIDAAAGRVMIFTPPNHVQVLRHDDTLDGGDVLPGFSCPVADLLR